MLDGYETIFLVEAAAAPLDLGAIREWLHAMGESVVVAGGPEAARVHVHSPLPEPIVAFAMTLGTVSRMTVERLDERAFGEIDDLGSASEACGARGGRRAIGERSEGGSSIELVERKRPIVRAFAKDGSVEIPVGEPAIVAVAAGDGIADLMRRDFDVTSIVRSGPGEKPNAGELLAAVEMSAAPETIIVANDSNVVLAARQVSSLAPRPVGVVQTRNAAEGFAALLAYDPELDLESNVAQMTEAAGEIRSFVVTEAVRDAVIDGRPVRAGELIAIDADERLVGVSRDPVAVVIEALAAAGARFELVTLYTGAGVEKAEADRLAERIESWDARVEVEIVPGGQPFHRYIVVVE